MISRLSSGVLCYLPPGFQRLKDVCYESLRGSLHRSRPAACDAHGAFSRAMGCACPPREMAHHNSSGFDEGRNRCLRPEGEMKGAVHAAVPLSQPFKAATRVEIRIICLLLPSLVHRTALPFLSLRFDAHCQPARNSHTNLLTSSNCGVNCPRLWVRSVLAYYNKTVGYGPVRGLGANCSGASLRSS